MKHINQDVSDEFLNAFVDDQLDSTEKSSAFTSIENDKILRERVCELRGLKEMVRHAYDRPSTRAGSTIKRRNFKKTYLQTLAAGMILAVGVASGWFAHVWTGSGSDLDMVRVLKNVQRNEIGAEPQKIILHIGSSNPVRLKTALDETENLLDSYRRSNKQLHVEVVANGGGLDLLRAGVSPYEKRIALMQKKYPDLDFIACSQTIQKLQAKGIEVQLLPKAGIATSAIDQITKRLKQDWVYIKV